MLGIGAWREIGRAEEWAEVLELPPDKEQQAALKNATNAGHPWGEDEFLRHVSAQTGRDISGPPRPRGRPAKTATATA